MTVTSSAHPHIRTSAHLVFLIGFMGCGKTYWGKKWSSVSGLEFFDIDAMVERSRKDLSQKYLHKTGEDFFRDLETVALRSFANRSNAIVACGGGTVCYNDNITWMNENGTSVYLRSSPKKILQRLEGEIHTRPMLKHLDHAEMEFYITEKIKEREAFYNLAKIILDVDQLDKDFVPDFLSELGFIGLNDFRIMKEAFRGNFKLQTSNLKLNHA